MERHANYALVGVLTTVLILGGLILAVWLANVSTSGKDEYRVVFKGPVRGLADGGDVQFNGIKVGQIQKIELVPTDTQLIAVDIEVKKGTPVRTDSVASTEMQGISGVNVVEISAGSGSRPLLREASHDKRPLIPSKPSGLSSLLDGGSQVMQGANEAMQRANRILSDQNIAALSATIQDIHALTLELAAHRAMVGQAAQTIAKLDRAADDVQGAAQSVRQIADGDGKRAANDVAAAARDLRTTLRQARGVMDKIEGDVNQVSTTTLPGLDQALKSVQDTAGTLDDVLRQIRRDPRGALVKPRTKELELPK